MTVPASASDQRQEKQERIRSPSSRFIGFLFAQFAVAAGAYYSGVGDTSHRSLHAILVHWFRFIRLYRSSIRQIGQECSSIHLDRIRDTWRTLYRFPFRQLNRRLWRMLNIYCKVLVRANLLKSCRKIAAKLLLTLWNIRMMPYSRQAYAFQILS